MAKVIVRIKGGLGNQLFCYAAARRLALVNNAELVLDDVSGFARDRQYCRKYMLDSFQIPARKATRAERLEPFERYRRRVVKWLAKRKPFEARRYLEQEGLDFDERILGLKVNRSIYLDGYWQSERYFKDVKLTIYQDLRIIPPRDARNQRTAKRIMNSMAVALHVRWFEYPESTGPYNLLSCYYKRAIAFMENKLGSPWYYVFSDDPQAARAKLVLPEERVTFVSNNRGHAKAYADMWLMRQCRHFIIANSTFSWWGAYMGTWNDKVVIAPHLEIDGKAAWGFKGLIPDEWITM